MVFFINLQTENNGFLLGTFAGTFEKSANVPARRAFGGGRRIFCPLPLRVKKKKRDEFGAFGLNAYLCSGKCMSTSDQTLNLTFFIKPNNK